MPQRAPWPLLACLLLGPLAGCRGAALTADTRFEWTPVGPGGGGAIVAPAVSPHDADLLLAGCDMSGVYRSADGGAHWQMLDGHQIRSIQGYGHSAWAFHPTAPNVILAGAAAAFLRSDDAGLSWRPIPGPWADHDRWSATGGPQVIEFDRARPNTVAAAFNRFQRDERKALFLSRDGGTTWTPTEPLPDSAGEVFGLVFDAREPGTLIAGCAGGVFASSDGAGWVRRTAGLDGDGAELLDFEGGTNATVTMLYATCPTRDDGGRLAGGVYRSADGGRTWRVAGRGLNTRLGREDEWSRDVPLYDHLACGDADPRTAWVSSHGTIVLGPHCSTIYRTTDGGESWTATLFGDPRMPEHNAGPDWVTEHLRWSWGDTAQNIRASDGDPALLLRTDNGRIQITRDGGRSWSHLQSPPTEGGMIPNGGLNVTTSWQAVADERDPRRRYLCYTDIGFFRSLDGGESWLYSTAGSPWTNTFYALAIDPDDRDRLWAAASNTHDIPYWGYVTRDARSYTGGVVRSDNAGESWRRVGEGSLPDGAAGDVWLDREPRRLWVAVMGHGVFTSPDGERWESRSEGLDLERNENLIRVRRDRHGRLLALVTMRYREDTRDLRAGGLFASLDDGRSWRRLDDGQTLWHPVEFAVDPRDADVIYVACMEAPIGKGGGGLWKTTDGGASWRLIHSTGPSFAPTPHPDNPDLVYHATYGDGLWASPDAGATWRRVEGLPFLSVHRVHFDPLRPKVIWVTTFGGGVWRGEAVGP